MLEPSKNGIAWIDDLTGGLNTTDPPEQIGDNQLQVAENIEWIETRVAQRRQGGQNNIGTEVWGAGKTLLWAFRHTPTADETAAELWAMSNDTPNILGRLAAGSNFSAVTLADAISTPNDAKYVEAVSFNGKMFHAGDTSVDRLHVWDGTSHRRAGLPAPGAAPTVADTGAGAYAAIKRWYKVMWTSTAGGGTPIRSEPSAVVSFTPSGGGTAARITRPTAPGEHETHWLVFASPDNVNFYYLATIVIGTTTYDDTTAPTAYVTTAFPALTATVTGDYYTTPPSAKYLLVDGARLLLLSSWETAAYTSRVWFTPILNTTPLGLAADDERVPSTNYLDLDPNDGGGITGGIMYDGAPHVFKLSRLYRLSLTTNPTKPYTRTIVSPRIGAISHRSIVLGEDDQGNECLYFLSRRGPYRLSPYGLEYLGRDLESGTWSRVTITATAGPPFGVYYEKKGQVWWWVAVDGATRSNLVLKLSVRYAKRREDGTVRGGWSTDTGDLGTSLCAIMFSKTLGATMSYDLKPYVGQLYASGDPDGPLYMYDADAVDTDNGPRATAYTGRIKGKAFNPGGRDKRGGLLEGFITAKATGAALTISAIRDYGKETIPAAVTIAGADTVSRDDQKIENLTVGDSKTIELTITDGGVARPWTLDAIGLRVKEEGPR